MNLEDIPKKLLSLEKEVAELRKIQSPDRVITRKEVCEILSCCSETIRTKYEKPGVLTNINPYGRPRYKLSEIQELVGSR